MRTFIHQEPASDITRRTPGSSLSQRCSKNDAKHLFRLNYSMSPDDLDGALAHVAHHRLCALQKSIEAHDTDILPSRIGALQIGALLWSKTALQTNDRQTIRAAVVRKM